MNLPTVDRRQHPGPCINPNWWIEAGNIETLLCDYCADIVRESGTNLLLNPQGKSTKGRPMNPSKRYRPTKAEVAAAETALRTLETRMNELSKENAFLKQSIATIGAAADKDTQRLYELTRNLAHAKGLLVTTLRAIRGPERELIRRFIDVPPFDRNEARSAAHIAADSVRYHHGIVQDTEGFPEMPLADPQPANIGTEAILLGRRR